LVKFPQVGMMYWSKLFQIQTAATGSCSSRYAKVTGT